MENCDIAIVGAGPFGISAAAYLNEIKGLEVRLFGEPMSFWKCRMPARGLMRSRWDASHISAPRNHLSLDVYRNSNGNHSRPDPIPVTEFIRYGEWFYRHLHAHVDRRDVTSVKPRDNAFEVIPENGRPVRARRVIVATGIECFAYRPEVFRGLPDSLVSHAWDHLDYSRFQNKEVVVIGGGQSALEAAAFSWEAGANVEILIRRELRYWRKPLFKWLGNPKWMRIFYGRGDVGPAGVSLIIQHPNAYRRLPRARQDRWDKAGTIPTFSYRQVPFLPGPLPARAGTFVREACEQDGRLRIKLNDGSERVVDHVILGTGYRVNIRRYRFLSQDLLQRVDIVEGYPRLDRGFETTLPGLHFVGAPAAWSFGPLVRFVAGTEFVSKAVQRRIAQSPKEPRHVSSTVPIAITNTVQTERIAHEKALS